MDARDRCPNCGQVDHHGCNWPSVEPLVVYGVACCPTAPGGAWHVATEFGTPLVFSEEAMAERRCRTMAETYVSERWMVLPLAASLHASSAEPDRG